ncbi:PREDICTED: EGF domain-specific O-linked N-acetylglucosamine transferase-like [Tarenaya hassleriana]|uniref:EGF domain-specific O-linked N-acetylglucosamine transferase-like n=1 Tax=Tarenaya hassleriana TaxID=28532 RepID=UPI00053C42BF|nr:PREDICTED: EGF domain-specific O-linked N-acetylglucosamine transferase-like [Tarenaya hassleriana]
MREKLVTQGTIFARSFSRNEQKKLGYAAIVVSLLVTFNIFAVLTPYFSPLPVLKLQLSVDRSLRMLRINNSSMGDSEIVIISDLNHENNISSTVPQKLTSSDTPKNANVVCHKLARTEFCQLSGDVRIEGQSATAFGIRSAFSESPSWKIKPYARKRDNTALKRVREWTIRSLAPNADQENAGFPLCDRNHSVPAVLFSLGGYSLNNFHGFADILLPLFLTARKFNGEVQFLVTDKNPLYVDKFGEAIRNLSSYELINIDEEKETHCFTNAIVGLKRHNDYNKEMYIDPSWSGFTMSDFRQFIRDAFALRNAAVAIKSKPRILILSRRRTRAFVNTEAMARMAEQMGFDVVVEEGNANLTRFGQVVNSCDLMIGVHGAGLTNMVFLPENAILIQVIPIGDFEWLARTDYEEPAKAMNLSYLEYKITPEESSLTQKYGRDHEVLKNAFAVGKRGWETFKAIYMAQNVSVDVDRFRPVLVRALDLLKQRM